VDFTMSKGVAIVGVGSTPCVVGGTLTIDNLPAGRIALLRNLNTDQGLGLRFRLVLTNCAGQVHCDGLTWNGYLLTPFSVHPAIVAQNVACFTVHRCTALGWPAVSAASSALSISESQLTGISGDVGWVPAQAISATGNSSIALASCLLRGGAGGWHTAQNGADAVTASGVSVLAAATNFIGGSAGYGMRGRSINLYGPSALVHDQACTFPDGIVGAGTVYPSEFCRLNGALPAPGASSSITTTGPSGVFALVVAGLPALPTDPLGLGLIWLDPSTSFVLQFGALPLPPIVVTAPAGTPHGLVYGFQTALFGSGIVLSPPLVAIVP
jgi:hypothetical protein